jgi:hypothetical protein
MERIGTNQILNCPTPHLEKQNKKGGETRNETNKSKTASEQ